MIENESSIGRRFSNGFGKAMVEQSSGGTVLTITEIGRIHFMYPPPASIMLNETTTPLINPDNTAPGLYYMLQHTGNSLEGYVFALAAYYGLSLLDSTQSLITRVNIPYRLRLAMSVMASSAAVGIFELGFLSRKQPDPEDIPAGVIGALMYVGLNFAIRRRLQRKESLVGSEGLEPPTSSVDKTGFEPVTSSV